MTDEKEIPAEPENAEPGFLGRMFGKLRGGLQKTSEKVQTALNAVLSVGRTVDEELLIELEEALIIADISPELSLEIVEKARLAYKNRQLEHPGELKNFIKNELKTLIGCSTDPAQLIQWAPQGPTIILIVGVNGSGKTTSIAKLARYFQKQGKSVCLAAGDTYRAAAVEQLSIWADRLGVRLIKQKMGHDPAAVAFDAVDAAFAKPYDVLIIDTAGRLQTQDNLMRELEKIYRVIQKKAPDAPHETLQIVDAAVGQNAFSQVSLFSKIVKVTGIVLTKMDGTAKGGAVIGVKRKLDVPVKFIGLGEGMDDFAVFNPEAFVEAIFDTGEGMGEDEIEVVE